MPVSLNNTDIVNMSIHYNADNTNEIRALKSTNQMVNEALIELHSVRGTSLRRIYNYILTNYNLEALTNSRKFLIKKHIIDLKASKDVENKTGKGLEGSLKLKDKKKFIGKLKSEEERKKAKRAAERKSTSAARKTLLKNASKKATTTSKANANQNKVKRKIKQPIIPSNQPTPVVPIQTTPVRNNHVVNRSMFDTPMLPSQVHASTPFVQSQIIPHAPDIRGKTNRKRILNQKNSEVGDTPRSSLPGKKRKIQKRGE